MNFYITSHSFLKKKEASHSSSWTLNSFVVCSAFQYFSQHLTKLGPHATVCSFLSAKKSR